MPRHNNPQPKFHKPYISWKGRARAMQTYLESTGHCVDYQEDWAVVMFNGQIKNPPKRWWQVWKWW